jgi:hypothetical protein
MHEMASDLCPSIAIWQFYLFIYKNLLMNFASHFCPSLFGEFFANKKTG